MSVTAIFEVAGAVLVSVGGATVILFALSTWLGKVWANRIMQVDRAKYEKELEHLRSELRRTTDTEIERLRHSQHAEMDVLIRRRKIYEQAIVSLRIFLTSAPILTEEDQKKLLEDKKKFLAAFDLCYLWASDSVISSLEVLITLIQQNTESLGSIAQKRLREAYSNSIIELRKDAGFLETKIKPETYPVVSFK